VISCTASQRADFALASRPKHSFLKYTLAFETFQPPQLKRPRFRAALTAVYMYSCCKFVAADHAAVMKPICRCCGSACLPFAMLADVSKRRELMLCWFDRAEQLQPSDSQVSQSQAKYAASFDLLHCASLRCNQSCLLISIDESQVPGWSQIGKHLMKTRVLMTASC
jgi:hypothetical protein